MKISKSGQEIIMGDERGIDVQSPPSGATTWNQYQSDYRHSGYIDISTPIQFTTVSFDDNSNIITQSVVNRAIMTDGDNVYITVADVDDNVWVMALDVQTMSTIWETELVDENNISPAHSIDPLYARTQNNVYTINNEGGIISKSVAEYAGLSGFNPPVIEDNIYAVISPGGPETPKLSRISTSDHSVSELADITYDDNIVISMSSDNIFIVNEDDDSLFKYDLSGNIIDIKENIEGNGIEGNPIVSPDEELVILPLAALETGTLNKRFDILGPTFEADNPVRGGSYCADQSSLYVLGEDNTNTATIISLSLNNGSEQWRTQGVEVTNAVPPLMVSNTALYFGAGSNGDTWITMDKSTGDIISFFDSDFLSSLSFPCMTEKALAYTSGEGSAMVSITE